MWFYNGATRRHPTSETETETEPAFTTTNGIKAWFRENQLHRVNGPAVIWDDGSQEWVRKNKLHRYLPLLLHILSNGGNCIKAPLFTIELESMETKSEYFSLSIFNRFNTNSKLRLVSGVDIKWS